MITIKDKRDCCGCWGCYSVCPKECISMEEDHEGFRYPIINDKECVDCGMCVKVCPVLSVEKEIGFLQKAYLIQHRDAIILKDSTSGGAYTAISQWVINQGGVVFGAAYDNNFAVVHCSVEKEEELGRFRNSKYSQSLIIDVFKQVKKKLEDGCLVCFSGTPCQVEGLYTYLMKKKYPNLLLIDLVCHAVPSPMVFRKYLKLKREEIGGKFISVLFRDKYYGYKYSTMSIYNVDKKKDYHKGVDTDVMMRSFFSDLSVRPSCTQCAFKKRYRVSDITIWDCFDVYKFSKEFDDDRGVTRALVHTDKGAEIIQEIKNYAKTLPIDVEKAVEGVKEMKHSVQYSPKRDHFFKDLNSMRADECFNKYFPITLRVRIERMIRLVMNRLGLYSQAKRFFKILFPRQAAIKR